MKIMIDRRYQESTGLTSPVGDNQLGEYKKGSLSSFETEKASPRGGGQYAAGDQLPGGGKSRHLHLRSPL